MTTFLDYRSLPKCDYRDDDPDVLVVNLTKGKSDQQYPEFNDKVKLLLLLDTVPIKSEEWFLIQKYCQNITELHIQGHWLAECDALGVLFQILSKFPKLVYVDAKCFGFQFVEEYWKFPIDVCAMNYSHHTAYAATVLIQKVTNNRKEFGFKATAELMLVLTPRPVCEVVVTFVF